MAASATTTPAWVASHAYLAGAVVQPTTPDGTNWRASVGGTSGLAQPTWPTAAPWTVTDGGVTWGKATSARRNFVAAIVSTATTFRAANPTMLLGIAAARPRSLTLLPLPGLYVGARDEQQNHTSGIRQRTFGGLSAVLVDQVPDNPQSQARLDDLVDALSDAFSSAYHAGSATSILQLQSVFEVPVPDGATEYTGNVFTFAPSFVTEGRG